MTELLYSKIEEDIKSILCTFCDDGRMVYHIFPVVNISTELAEYYSADVFVVRIAAYLHDVTRIQGDIKNHHITGAKYAGEFLSTYGLEDDVIDHIKKCILNHRGSITNERKSIEEKIVASADAASHILYPLPLFYAWYGKKGASIDAGAQEIKNKIVRSWNKIELDYIKEVLKKRYEALMEVLR